MTALEETRDYKMNYLDPVIVSNPNLIPELVLILHVSISVFYVLATFCFSHAVIIYSLAHGAISTKIPGVMKSLNSRKAAVVLPLVFAA